MPLAGPVISGVTSAALEIPIRVDNNGVQSVSLSSGITFANTAGGAQKAEDSAHADGDIGFHTLGVRRGATPVVATSAIGDYGSFAIDGEGKIIISGSFAAPEQTEQAYVSPTGVADTNVFLLSGAGVRHYITDAVFANTGGSASTVAWNTGPSPLLERSAGVACSLISAFIVFSIAASSRARAATVRATSFLTAGGAMAACCLWAWRATTTWPRRRSQSRSSRCHGGGAT